MIRLQDFKTADDRQVYYIEDHCADGGVPLLKFYMLEQLKLADHGITTRVGGVSKGMFRTLNVSYTRGDEKTAVDENFHRTAVSLHADVSDFVLTDQTHTVRVRRVTREDCGKGVLRQRDYQDVDGLITNEPGIVLAAFFADCVPLLFIDPVHGAAGVSHSGWRGTLAALRFMEEFQGAGEALCIPKEASKYQLNLWKANELALLKAGILKEHLAVTNICTCCNPKLLFSHRASQGKRGNFGAFLKLR